MDDVKMDDVSVVREFIARINAADVEGLGRLMAPDHSLEVFDEAPFVGRDEEHLRARHGYAGSWPSYHIYEDAIGRRGEWLAVLGHTTGSDLELPDEEEEKLTLIWVADVVDGLCTPGASSPTRSSAALGTDIQLSTLWAHGSHERTLLGLRTHVYAREFTARHEPHVREQARGILVEVHEGL